MSPGADGDGGVGVGELLHDACQPQRDSGRDGSGRTRRQQRQRVRRPRTAAPQRSPATPTGAHRWRPRGTAADRRDRRTIVTKNSKRNFLRRKTALSGRPEIGKFYKQRPSLNFLARFSMITLGELYENNG